jgi:hypothetical protein
VRKTISLARESRGKILVALLVSKFGDKRIATVAHYAPREASRIVDLIMAKIAFAWELGANHGH